MVRAQVGVALHHDLGFLSSGPLDRVEVQT
jgi:hypothetical protein